MVFFNCNACGEAMKKNQVEKHTLRCRQCHSVSCVDCGKDFVGNDYQTHTKCMTEEEKYCGKGYVPKVNKGEAKQEQWIERVQEAIAKSTSKPNLRKLLERLTDYPNIPRKKAKFENFLKNSLRVTTPYLVTEVWEVLMEAAPVPSKPQQNGSSKQSEPETAKENETAPDETPEENDEAQRKLNKREKKEERQKKNKKEKKDRMDEDNEGEAKRGKKRKHEDTETTAQAMTEAETTLKKKKKKKDRAEPEEELPQTVENSAISENGHKLAENKESETSFNLETTILNIVRKKEEISLKKLRKKVVNCFHEQNPPNLTEERLLKKFDKKINKMNQIAILKDKAMLKKVLKKKYNA